MFRDLSKDYVVNWNEANYQTKSSLDFRNQFASISMSICFYDCDTQLLTTAIEMFVCVCVYVIYVLPKG